MNKQKKRAISWHKFNRIIKTAQLTSMLTNDEGMITHVIYTSREFMYWFEYNGPNNECYCFRKWIGECVV